MGGDASDYPATVRLDPIVAGVLACLIEQPGRLLTRDEFMHRVWQDRVVVDEALTRCISVLRQVFGDRRPHRVVQTLPKRGYRWIGTVSAVAESHAAQPMPEPIHNNCLDAVC